MSSQRPQRPSFTFCQQYRWWWQLSGCEDLSFSPMIWRCLVLHYMVTTNPENCSTALQSADWSHSMLWCCLWVQSGLGSRNRGCWLSQKLASLLFTREILECTFCVISIWYRGEGPQVLNPQETLLGNWTNIVLETFQIFHLATKKIR